MYFFFHPQRLRKAGRESCYLALDD